MFTPFKKIFTKEDTLFNITQWSVVIYSTKDEKQASKLLTKLNKNWNDNGRDAMKPTQNIINDFLAGVK